MFLVAPYDKSNRRGKRGKDPNPMFLERVRSLG